MPDEHWNAWSAHTLQRRWLTMKRSIKGHESMTHAGMFLCCAMCHAFVQSSDYTEIMDILRTKKAQSPPPISTRAHKKITSAETIADSDDEDDGNGDVRGSSSSSSTGLGSTPTDLAQS